MNSKSDKTIVTVIKKYEFEFNDLKSEHQQAETLLQQLQEKYGQTKAIIASMEDELRRHASANNILSLTDISLRQNYIRLQQQNAVQDKLLRDKAQECKNIAVEKLISKRFDISALEKMMAKRKRRFNYEQARINQKEVDELWILRG